MRILFVAPYLPIPQRSGGKVRVFHVLRELAKTEDITLACYVSRESEPFVREIERWGIEARSIAREVRRRPLFRHLRYLPTGIPFSLVDPDHRMRGLVERLWSERDYDLLQVEFLAMGYVAESPIFEGRRFLTHHYSAADAYRRTLEILPKSYSALLVHRVDAAKMPFYERRMLERFSLVFLTSKRDRSLLSRVAPHAKFVVANNGVDTEFYQSTRQGAAAREKLLVSTCSFLTDSNIDSVVWFLERDLAAGSRSGAGHPIPNHRLRSSLGDTQCCCSSLPCERLGGVDDVRPYLDRAVASLITMRAGSGTKIRALTSLSMGCPIIATPLGAEGLEGNERDGIFVSDSPDSIAGVARACFAEGFLPRSVNTHGGMSSRTIRGTQLLRPCEKLQGRLGPMKNVVSDLWLLLDRRSRFRAAGLFLMMLIAAGLEGLGIGAIMPFLALLTAAGNPENMPPQIARLVAGRDPSSTIVIAALLLLALYIAKNSFLFLTDFTQFRFVFATSYRSGHAALRSVPAPSI